MVTAAFVLWPLAQPDPGRSPQRYIGILVLLAGLGLTAIVRSDEPWSPRHPRVTYVGYQLDQDTGRAWRFAPATDRSLWTDNVLIADGGEKLSRSHWAWRRPMNMAKAKPLPSVPPDISLVRQPDGTLTLHAAPPAGARTVALQLRSSVSSRTQTVAGVPTELALPPGKWVKIYWQAAGNGLDLSIRPTASGRLDVRYVAGIDHWPEGATPLPQRPADLMPWDDSDSTFLTGTRAYAW